MKIMGYFGVLWPDDFGQLGCPNKFVVGVDLLERGGGAHVGLRRILTWGRWGCIVLVCALVLRAPFVDLWILSTLRLSRSTGFERKVYPRSTS